MVGGGAGIALINRVKVTAEAEKVEAEANETATNTDISLSEAVSLQYSNLLLLKSTFA